MILSGMGNPFGYNGYGCWCGKGNRGDLVVDETDRCCQIHDRCWEAVEINHGCDPFWRIYDYKTLANHTIQCTDPIKTCDYHSCQCDKAAVECFARHRNTSYDSDFDNWKGLCTTATRSPENDPETCPPVWDAREKYTSDSLVSIHGIVYQSLYTSSPGQNPLNNLATSHYHGIMATWKKLSECRRTI
ncbi:unnamed protein product [Adineta steineri]|uniref:Phospholipase A2 n=1 Tax=Adineta steineri TaxID=433720 RepID=A0A819NTN9_9BILA|nr:unnamed protein product [Adineta steineri]CAF0866691.1 unnamed protein product [Adineta steineri]CAF3664373.1 unnamed protein product [Adineta steineri]CAF3999597.1 unnamed protein product [Adineta steineri]